VFVAKLTAVFTVPRKGIGNVTLKLPVNNPVADVAGIPPTAMVVAPSLKSKVGPTVVEVFLQVIEVT
jgi:hypothetical protein